MPLPVKLLLLGAALLAGCGADSPAGEPEVILGTGATAFESLAEGGDIYVIQGPQGGFHLLGSVRARNLEPGDPQNLSSPDNPTIEFRVFAGTQRVDLMAAVYTQGLDDAGGGAHEMVGRLVLLDIAADDELDGVMIRFEVDVVDVDGMSASDARQLRAVAHPANL